MVVYLHLRVHQRFPDVIAFIKSVSSQFLCVEEVGDEGRPHMHCHVRFDRTLSTFRQKFRKQFPEFVGNRDYSLSERREVQERLDRYLCKGSCREIPPVIAAMYGSLYTQEYVSECQRLYWVEQDEIASRNSRSSSVSRQPSFVEYCIDECLQTISNEHQASEPVMKVHIFKTVLRCLGKKAKILDGCIINRLCYGVMNRLLPDATRRHFIHTISFLEDVDSYFKE